LMLDSGELPPDEPAEEADGPPGAAISPDGGA
jgi:hypothetical protein